MFTIELSGVGSMMARDATYRFDWRRRFIGRLVERAALALWNENWPEFRRCARRLKLLRAEWGQYRFADCERAEPCLVIRYGTSPLAYVRVDRDPGPALAALGVKL